VLIETDLRNKHLLVGGLALLTTIFLCYGQILFKMAKRWTVDPNYSHGFLIPFLSGYLLWRKKDAFSLSAINPELKGLPVLMLGLFLMVLAKAGTIDFVMLLSFLMVLMGLSLFLLGTNITKSALFLISYLIFMIPLPTVLYNDLTFRLTLLASIISTKLVALMGFPAFREGSIIHLSNTSLQVIEACSGLRSLIALLALAVLFAYFTQTSTWKRLSLVLLTIPITIFSNSCRLTVTAILVEKIGPQATEGFFHIFTGIIMFVIALVLLMLCGTILNRFRY
jgi:exosortase